MSKFYLRIQMNTRHHFSNMLPLTTNDWRTSEPFAVDQEGSHGFAPCSLAYQQTSPMMAACEMILKSILNQSEYLDVQSTLDVYERILASFTETWTSILLERKYRFSYVVVLFAVSLLGQGRDSPVLTLGMIPWTICNVITSTCKCFCRPMPLILTWLKYSFNQRQCDKSR